MLEKTGNTGIKRGEKKRLSPTSPHPGSSAGPFGNLSCTLLLPLTWKLLRFFFKNISYIYWLHWIFVAAHGLSLSCSKLGPHFLVVRGLLIVVASLVEEYRLQQSWPMGSRAQVQ